MHICSSESVGLPLQDQPAGGSGGKDAGERRRRVTLLGPSRLLTALGIELICQVPEKVSPEVQLGLPPSVHRGASSPVALRQMLSDTRGFRGCPTLAHQACELPGLEHRRGSRGRQRRLLPYRVQGRPRAAGWRAGEGGVGSAPGIRRGGTGLPKIAPPGAPRPPPGHHARPRGTTPACSSSELYGG